MSAGGVGELDAQRGQRQGLAASVVRHDEMIFVTTVASNVAALCSSVMFASKRSGCMC